MKTRLLAGSLLLLVLATAFLAMRARTAIEAAGAMETRRFGLQAEAFRAETTRKAAETKILSLTSQVAALRRQSAPAVSVPAPAALPNKVFIAADREWRASYLGVFRPSLDFTYGAFFRARGYSSDEIALVKELKTRAEDRSLDALLNARDRKLDPKGEEYLALMRDAEDSGRTPEESEFLVRFDREVAEFNQSVQLRNVVAQLSSTMIGGEAGLPLVQVEKVVQILAAHSQLDASGVFRRTSIDWDGALPALEKELDPVQLTSLRRMSDQWDIIAKMGEEARRVAAPYTDQLAKLAAAAANAAE